MTTATRYTHTLKGRDGRLFSVSIDVPPELMDLRGGAEATRRAIDTCGFLFHGVADVVHTYVCTPPAAESEGP